jgi:hypothetical protein
VVHIDLNDGVGDRSVVVRQDGSSVNERLGAGDLSIDLTQLPPGADADVHVVLGAGMLSLYIPEDANVRLTGLVGLGTIERSYLRQNDRGDYVGGWAFHEPVGGFDQPLEWQPRADPTPDGGFIRIDAHVSLGSVRIIYVHRGRLG